MYSHGWEEDPCSALNMVEKLTAELEKERAARKGIAKEKSDLEYELESLSQSLFEEVRISVLTKVVILISFLGK